ncbi:MAG: 3-oxoacyl-[acyl-carrier-protein] reductase [Anaerolineae bacterium]|nr:3-oxoacyl-[acyl-carrier-protein] reductase [Anaerolineae bacterium]
MTTTNRFQDKVVIVTGGANGIGQATMLGFAQEGARVVIVDLADRGEAVAGQINKDGGNALFIKADVSNADQVQSLVNTTLDKYGQIDILINNAGITRDNLIMKMKEDDWNLVLRVNLSSVYQCSRAVVRPMMKKRYGRIINLTSVVGLAGQSGQTNYAASKAGIIGFTKSLAKEVGSRNITVNAVAPGFIKTQLTDVLPAEMVQTTVQNTPLGRLGEVEDVAKAIWFLASDDAAFITGQVLTVDGGLVMQ